MILPNSIRFSVKDSFENSNSNIGATPEKIVTLFSNEYRYGSGQMIDIWVPSSLLKMFGLEDRLVLSSDEYKSKQISSSIIEAQKKLEILRSESVEWLKSALS